MKKNIAILLFLLGLFMIYLGGFHGEKVILPPIVTGVGFLAISYVFLKDKSE